MLLQQCHLVIKAPPCLRHRGGLGVGLCACDRAGLRPPCLPAAPGPVAFQRIRPIKKTLTAKLDMIAKFTGKFLLETRGPLAGNAMFPRTSSRRDACRAKNAGRCTG
jgi:hypothetical protein